MTSTKGLTATSADNSASAVLCQLEEACSVLSPGDAFPSYREWMKRLSASERAVRWALKEMQRQGKIETEVGRGTFVVETEPRQRTGIVGISGADFSQSQAYWNPFLEGIRQVATANDVQLLLLSYNVSVDWKNIDGIIVHRTDLPYSGEVLQGLPSGKPSIAVLVPVPDMPCVLVDDYQGCYSVVDHLVKLGHRRIAYLHDYRSKRRIAAFRDALEENGIMAEVEWLRPLSQVEDTYATLGHSKMKEWLQDNWNELGCTALVTQNDDTAMGAILALREAGISVPEEVSVAGFDDTEVARYFSPTLTSVSVPLQEIGATAMELLLRQISGEKVPVSSTVFPATLVARDSTRQPVSSRMLLQEVGS